MDGVGDYTSLLAGQLSALGHSCSIVALADPHVIEMTGSLTTSLRIPVTAPWPERIAQAKRFCEEFAPDWISFQVVPYAYDSRGLCFGLGTHFRAIAGDCPSEIMFHEIWIGLAEEAPLKNKLMGKLQRHIIKDLLKQVAPRVIHTHTPLYRQMLGALDAEAKILPLFGNITIAEKLDPEWLSEKWPALWGRILVSGRAAWLIFVIFGSIHPEWDGEDFWRRATEAAQKAGKTCAFISIGRPGGDGEAILAKLRHHENWLTLNLGGQSPADISQCLRAADFGVSPVPPEYLSKSGTAIAMLEHGLPVIATRAPYRYRNCPAELLDTDMKNVVHDFALESLQKTAPRARLPEIAQQFAADLQGAGTP
jgi:glycosyltransferase involved in cell wall biosynthesis